MDKEKLKEWLYLHARCHAEVMNNIFPQGAKYDRIKVLTFDMVQIFNGREVCELLDIPYETEPIKNDVFKGVRIIFSWDNVKFVSLESEE